MHARKALRVVIAVGVLAVGPALGCLSFGDLSGGGGAGSNDASSPISEASDDSSTTLHYDAGENSDGAPITFASCAAAHAIVPAAPDGFFPLSGVDGGPTLEAYCDMTQDNGGWMLVTPAMIVAQTFQGGVATNLDDVNGGLVVENYPNDNPCGVDAGPVPRDLITFDVDRPWAQIRALYSFNGLVSCSSVFGSADLGATKNTIPFDISTDLIRGAFEMGGISADGGPVDAFNGVVRNCSASGDNFWYNNDSSERAVTLALRRDLPGPAGISTQANCFTGPVGTSATAWWEYRDIFVR